MTDEEAVVWLKEHKAELEAIVLTNRMVEEFVPGSTLATLVLSSLTSVSLQERVLHGRVVLRDFAKWSASR